MKCIGDECEYYKQIPSNPLIHQCYWSGSCQCEGDRCCMKSLIKRKEDDIGYEQSIVQEMREYMPHIKSKQKEVNQ